MRSGALARITGSTGLPTGRLIDRIDHSHHGRPILTVHGGASTEFNRIEKSSNHLAMKDLLLQNAKRSSMGTAESVWRRPIVSVSVP